MKKEKCISQRGNSYQVRIKYYENGVRKEYTKSFKMRQYKSDNECLKQAMKHRDEMLFKLDTVGIVTKDKTLSQVYEESKNVFPMSLETVRKHDIQFRDSLEIYGNKPIKEITAKDITLTLNRAMNKSQEEIKRLLSVWRLVYRTAIICDYVYMDMTIKVKQPKSQKIPTPPKEESLTCTMESVISALTSYGCTESTRFLGKILSYAMMIMYCLGIRPSECYALQKNDFNFKKKNVIINKAVGSTTTEMLTIKTAKTVNSIRFLALPDSLIPHIKELFKFQPRETLFTDFEGNLLSSKRASAFIHMACKKSGIEFHSYVLRHDFVTKLLETGYDVRTIQDLMGHATSEMTVYYARSNQQRKDKAIRELGLKLGTK